MKSWRGAAGAAAVLLVLGAAVYLAASVAERPAPDLDEELRAVASQLRCLQCQGLSAWDSNTESSLQMRAEIRQLLEQGLSRAEIVQHYVDRYGSWVLITPPLRGFSALAYVVPAAGLLVGAVVLRRLLRAGFTVVAERSGGSAPGASGAPAASGGRPAPDPEAAEPSSGGEVRQDAGGRRDQVRPGHLLVDDALRRYEGYDG